MMKFQVSAEEALRYIGANRSTSPELTGIVEEILQHLDKTVPPRWIFRICSVVPREEGLYLPEAEMTLSGQMAGKMLAESKRAVLLACTLGTTFDTMLRAEQARDMSRAVITDACGSALIEAGCDAAEQELAALYPEQFLTDRFSPGYGDLPLALQAKICRALDTPRRLGVTVGNSFMMNPCKSVTAVIGLADRPQPAKIRGCAYCALQATCQYRKGGQFCDN